MFQRRLGQEEMLNKQLAIQNTKLGTNLSDLRGQIIAEKGAEEADLFRGVSAFYPPPSFDGVSGGNAVESEEILERKKAWAELEREQNEVKRNIKSLMKFEPGTRVIDDPSLAERIKGVRSQPQSYETAEDLATEQRMQAHFGSAAGKAASPAQPAAKSKVGTNQKLSNSKSLEKDSVSPSGKKDT